MTACAASSRRGRIVSRAPHQTPNLYRRAGINVLLWREGEQGYALVFEVNAQDLKLLASYLALLLRYEIVNPGCVAKALSITRLARWRAAWRSAQVVRRPSA